MSSSPSIVIKKDSPIMVNSEYITNKKKQFPKKLQKYKEISKEIILQNSGNEDFYDHNQFTNSEDDMDLNDWIIINSSDETDIKSYEKQGFLMCYLPENDKNVKFKFISHWVSLEDNYLTCYQSKDSGYQLKYRKLHLQGGVIINAQSYTKKKNSFRISCVGESNTCYFLCKNSKEYNQWFTIISKSIESFKNIKEQNIPCLFINPTQNLRNSQSLDDLLEHDCSSFNLIYVEDNNNLLSKEELEFLDQSLEKHLSKHPECAGTIIPDHVEMILHCEGHPLSVYYNNSITHWKEQHYFMVYTATDENMLKSSVNVIKEIIYKIVNEFLCYYSQLSAFSKCKQYCTKAVEYVLFEELFEYIFSMYKLCYKQDDILVSQKIDEFSSITAAHFGISSDLWLLNDITHKIPYQEAVEIFKKIRDLKTPNEKVKCLYKTGKAIYTCISQYYSKYEPDKHITLSGDDLLPLFAYTVIRSQVPHCYSEFRFIEDFLNSFQRKGEIYYFFVTYSTSLSLISFLSEDTLSTWFEQDNDIQNDSKKPKRKRVSSLIEVELNDDTQLEDNRDDSKAFLSWASSLIRK